MEEVQYLLKTGVWPLAGHAPGAPAPNLPWGLNTGGQALPTPKAPESQLWMPRMTCPGPGHWE